MNSAPAQLSRVNSTRSERLISDGSVNSVAFVFFFFFFQFNVRVRENGTAFHYNSFELVETIKFARLSNDGFPRKASPSLRQRVFFAAIQQLNSVRDSRLHSVSAENAIIRSVSHFTGYFTCSAIIKLARITICAKNSKKL